MLKEFLDRYPGQSIMLTVVLLLAGVADGFGVSALLPALELAFQNEGGITSDNTINQFFLDLLASLDLSPTLASLLGVILVGICLKNAFVFFAEQRIGYIAASVTTRFRMRLLRAVTSSRWSFFVSQSAGRLANSMATEAWRASNAYVYGMRLLALCVEAAVYAVVAMLVSWQATLLCLAASLVIVVISHRFVRISKNAGIGQTQWYRSLLATLTDLLGSIKSFKAMGRDHSAEEVLSLETKRLKHALKREVLGNAALEAAQEPMYMIVIGVGIYLAIVQYQAEMATVTAMGLILTKLLRQFGKVQKQYQRLAACESAYWALEETIADAETQRETWLGQQQQTLSREIALRNVSFDYAKADVEDAAVKDPVIRSLDLTIPARALTTIVGESGAGKTTVIDLITGLIQPTSGGIYIDDVLLADMDLQSWRQQIGYVPQENILLHDTLFHNVTLGDESISDADVEAALAAAGALDFAQKMPEGIHSIVGERGANLSGGQRQRVMIARAIVRKPSLLILDEATSALDPETEEVICDALSRLKQEMTVIAISHQSALTRVADQVVRLERGQRSSD